MLSRHLPPDPFLRCFSCPLSTITPPLQSYAAAPVLRVRLRSTRRLYTCSRSASNHALSCPHPRRSIAAHPLQPDHFFSGPTKRSHSPARASHPYAPRTTHCGCSSEMLSSLPRDVPVQCSHCYPVTSTTRASYPMQRRRSHPMSSGHSDAYTTAAIPFDPFALPPFPARCRRSFRRTYPPTLTPRIHRGPSFPLPCQPGKPVPMQPFQ